MSLVLIIDDDAAMRDVLRQTFERAGFEVETAVDGNEGFVYMHGDPVKAETGGISSFDLTDLYGS